MPTRPPKDLYDPNFALVASNEFAELACPALEEIIAWDAAVFARCAVDASADVADGDKWDAHFAVFIPFHHLLEMLDATSRLIRCGHSIAARLVLRSVFESLLTIEYVLQGDFLRRAYAFLVGNVMWKLDLYRVLTPGTKERAEHDRALAGDRILKSSVLPEVPDVAAREARLLGLLSRPNWREAADAWDTMKKVTPYPNWFTLHGGPRTIKGLARTLGRSYEYQILYSPWSRTMHGLDLDRIFNSKGGVTGFASIPNWTDVKAAASFGMTFGLSAGRAVLHRYRDSEVERNASARWYIAEIRDAYQKVTGGSGSE